VVKGTAKEMSGLIDRDQKKEFRGLDVGIVSICRYGRYHSEEFSQGSGLSVSFDLFQLQQRRNQLHFNSWIDFVQESSDGSENKPLPSNCACKYEELSLPFELYYNSPKCNK
jgi:hypothetical protein